MTCKVIFPFMLLSLFSFSMLLPVSICHGEKLPVAASIFPVADMIRQVGGDNVDVITIIPPGASPHTFSLKPSQVKRISSSRVYFAIGAGLENWADKFVSGSMTKIILSEGIDLIQSAEHHHDEEDGENELKVHEPEAFANPHIWLDPLIAVTMVDKIVTGLSQSDMTHQSDYQKNGRLYQQQLYHLDAHIRETVSGFTIKKYVSFHPAWIYFAKRYGLESAGVIEASPGHHPTPRTVINIVDQIKSHQIRAVFAEPQLNPRIAEVIAREANATVLFLDPIGGPAFAGRQTYVDLMKYNLSILEEAMK